MHVELKLDKLLLIIHLETVSSRSLKPFIIAFSYIPDM